MHVKRESDAAGTWENCKVCIVDAQWGALRVGMCALRVGNWPGAAALPPFD